MKKLVSIAALLVLGTSTVALADCMYRVTESTQITKSVMRFKAKPQNSGCESYFHDEIFVENPKAKAAFLAALKGKQSIELPSKAVPMAEGFSSEGLAEVAAYKASLEQLLEDPIYNDPCSSRYWDIQDMLNSLYFAQAYTGTVE